MPSFDSVNYSIRPNKAVERSIVFSDLVKLSRIVDLATHQYLGLGSIWFVDFLMAHKVLGIRSMISIEKDEIGYVRAEYNRPLSCIKVEKGETTNVIRTIKLEDSPSVVWFDYDTSIGGPVLSDIGLLVPKCAQNSIVIVTINAKADELPNKDENDHAIDQETSLRRIAGDLVPTPLDRRRFQRPHYPKLLGEILANHFQNVIVDSGRAESFVKLFDLAYSDGTPMITLGGIIAPEDKVEKIQGLVNSTEWAGIVPDLITVPPLTVKEKLALDRSMPSNTPLSDSQMKKIGFLLKRNQIDAYHKYYLHYPLFGQIDL